MFVFETNYGAFTVELDQDKVPKTCENFIDYIRSGFYDNTLFHRVISGFVIQGGGFSPDMVQKKTSSPIENEADLGERNLRGTLSMARTSDPHSATSQFFISLKDNDFLDFKSKDMAGWGYCVFGRVTSGMEVIDKIATVATTMRDGHQDVPAEDVILHSVTDTQAE